MTRSIKAFFEPGPPPAPLPLLTSQTDLFYAAHLPSTVLAHEELVFKPPHPAPLPAQVNGGVTRTQKRHHPRRLGPYPSTHAIENAPRDEESSASSSSSDSESDDSDDGKIPKPTGEPGRPGRGGYNLEEALNWNPNTFKKLKVMHPPRSTVPN
jgi:hypothetical protein